MKWRQILIVGVLVLAGIFGGWWAFQPQPIGVDLATIERGTLIVTVDDEGVAQIRDTYQISTPIAGGVQRTPFTVGDLVGDNQIVATIVPPLSGFLDERSLAEALAAVRTAEAAVMSAETDIAGAKSEILFWQSEANRTGQLFERGLTTAQAAEQAQFQLDRAEVVLANANAAHELRQRQLEQAEARLLEPTANGERTISYDIRSPVAGQVLEVANESKRNLPAGAHLLTIGNPRDLEIVVDLLSTDAVGIIASAPAIIDGWGGGIELDAEVRRIEPIGFTKVSALGIEEQRVRVHLEITTEPSLWFSLGHLYRVFVRVQTQKVEDAILVPTAALFRNEDEWTVIVHEDGIAHLQAVSLGARDASYASVQSGLEVGKQVILHPNDQIVEGGLIIDRADLDE